MTDYSDLPEVNALYAEQQQVEAAITNIDNGGTLTNMTVGPPPPGPPGPPSQIMSPVIVTFANPPSAALVDAARAALVQRSDEITQQLADLGVTDTPPARASAARPGT